MRRAGLHHKGLVPLVARLQGQHLLKGAGTHLRSTASQRLRGASRSLHVDDLQLQPLGPEITQLIGNRQGQVMQGRLAADGQHHAAFFRLGLRRKRRHRQAGRSQHAGAAELTAGKTYGTCHESLMF